MVMDIHAGDDDELRAMQTIKDALDRQDDETKQRILRWVTDRYMPKRQPGARGGRPRKAAAA